MFIDKTINIPARDNAPETNLFVKIYTKNTNSLKLNPYLFLFPGGPGYNHSNYAGYCYLHTVVNVVLFDPRGCGLSDKGDINTYSIENTIHDVEIIRQHLGVNDMILFGPSAGGFHAIAYTLHYPQHVKKLLLIATTHCSHLHSAYENIKRKGTHEQIVTYEKFLLGDFKSQDEWDNDLKVLESLYRSNSGNEQVPKKVTDLLSVFIRPPFLPYAYQVYNNYMQTTLKTYDYTDKLSEIKCPTLIMCGDDDWICDGKHSITMSEKIPNNKLVIIKNAGHDLIKDAPQEFFSTINEFIQK